METKIFYSWQSDSSGALNRNFIQSTLEQAIKELGRDPSVFLEPVIDRDTAGISGAPDIENSIFAKIDKAAAFVADVSFVGKGGTKSLPNSNVMIELGYAFKALGHEKVLMVHNLCSGDISELPFDIRGKRIISYSLTESSDKANVKNELKNKLKVNIKSIIDKLIEEVEVPLLLIFHADGLHDGINMKLHPSWSKEQIILFATEVFANNPDEAKRKKFSTKYENYHVIDIIAEKIIQMPDVAGELTTDKILLIGKKTFEIEFSDLTTELKTKAFAKMIKMNMKS